MFPIACSLVFISGYTLEDGVGWNGHVESYVATQRKILSRISSLSNSNPESIDAQEMRKRCMGMN